MITFCAASNVKARWWCTSSILPPASLTTPVIRASEPGTSRAHTFSRASRPARTIPRWMMAASSMGSMLPPPSTTPTLRPANSAGSFIMAASGAAPAPSTSVFSMSSSSTMPCSMSPSSTSTTSSTYFSTSSRVKCPGRPTAMPSAMVDPPCGRVACLTALYMLGKRSACTPTTRMPGLSALAAAAMPPISPPPPIATTRVSSCGTASSISSATVPWPAMIASSS